MSAAPSTAAIIFAPVAAHLARGVPARDLGSLIADPVHLPVVLPVRHGDGHISGQVIYVDRFGNLITDIPGAWVVDGRWHCEIAGQRIGPLAATYRRTRRRQPARAASRW